MNEIQDEFLCPEATVSLPVEKVDFTAETKLHTFRQIEATVYDYIEE